MRPVAFGGVDEIHIQLGQPAQRAQRFVAIRGLAPDALAGNPHGAKTQAVDLEIAADGELS